MQGKKKYTLKGLKEDVLIVGGMSAAIRVPLKIVANVFSPSYMKMSLTMLVHCTGMMEYQKECHGVQNLLTVRDGWRRGVESVAKIAQLKKVRIRYYYHYLRLRQSRQFYKPLTSFVIWLLRDYAQSKSWDMEAKVLKFMLFHEIEMSTR